MILPSKRLTVFVLTMLLVTPEPLLAQAGPELLDRARKANKTSVGLAEVMSAEISFTAEAGGEAETTRAEYHRTPQATRVREKNAKNEVVKDVLFQDGRQRAVIGAQFRNKADRYVSALIAKDTEIITSIDGWGLALFTLPRSRLPLDEVLIGATDVSASATSEGRVRILFNTPDGVKYVVHTNPKYNHLIDEVELTNTRQDAAKKVAIHRVYRVESFQEVSAGVFVPRRIVSRHSENGREVVVHTVDLSNVRLDEKPTAGRFTLTFPPGVYVSDKIAGTVYQVGENERVKGKVMRAAEAAMIVRDENTPQSLPTDVRDESNGKLYWWLAAAFGAVAILTCGLAWFRRRKRRDVS